MTNKMPVVGKRYRPLQKESFVWAEFKRFSLLNGGVVIFCDLQQVCTDGVSNGYYSCQLKDFWDRFEELPEDNSQEQEEVPEVASKDFMEGYNAGWNDFGFKKDYRFKESTDNEPKVIENTNPVDFKKEEVNEVDRALGELKREIALCGGGMKPAETEGERRMANVFYYFLGKAQKLVDALEAEKSAMDAVKDALKCGIKQMKDFNAKLDKKYPMSKPEPKWLPMSCAPKDGSVIIVQQKDNKRHKIFKAQWFLNKWYSLYEEGGNEQVYPEFWLEVSKEEPKIDIKEEHVDPVSIWKDVSELPEGLLDEGIVKWRRGGHSLMLTAQGKFFDSSGHRVSSGESVAKFISLTDFINFFEQMQKDIEDLKRKWQ